MAAAADERCDGSGLCDPNRCRLIPPRPFAAHRRAVVVGQNTTSAFANHIPHCADTQHTGVSRRWLFLPPSQRCVGVCRYRPRSHWVNGAASSRLIDDGQHGKGREGYPHGLARVSFGRWLGFGREGCRCPATKSRAMRSVNEPTEARRRRTTRRGRGKRT